MLVLSVLCACTALGIGTLTAAAYDNWGDAYADFLRKEKKALYDNNVAGFALAYIDSDNVPELFYDACAFAGRIHEIDLYTFRNGNITLIEHFNASVVSYYDRCGWIRTADPIFWNGFQGECYTYYSFSGTQCNQVERISHDITYNIEDGSSVETYEINDVETSKEKFDQRFDYYNNTYGEIVHTDYIKLTEANISSVLKSSGTTAPTTTTH